MATPNAHLFGCGAAKELEAILESLIDRHGLTHVVNTLAIICTEKGDHLLTNWQDDKTARLWTLDGKTLDKAARNILSDG